MSDQRIPDTAPRLALLAPSPAEAVAARIEARRTALQLRYPLAPVGAVCDGWGAVAVLGADGEYEPAACQGCALCSTVREPVSQANPFARLPHVPSDDELEM